MRELRIPDDIEFQTGSWRARADIEVSNLQKREIYRAPSEPSYVSWAILWKERSGAFKLSFVEVSGDQTAWPPDYNFNSRGIRYYLKTLVTRDKGLTWADTGWREDLDALWELNCDHHIRHVFELPDGTLLRNYSHTIEGVTAKYRRYEYDEGRATAGEWPFTVSGLPTREIHTKFASIWKSADGGKSWKEIHLFKGEGAFFITAIHPLRDGTIVALGALMPDWSDPRSVQGAVSESRDGGSSWSEPAVIAPNDDQLNPQGIGEEADFVELEDGRLLVIWRTDAAGSCMRQFHLSRDRSGKWANTPVVINRFFQHSGYPYMHQASDGTVFYYCHTAMKYSCDEGASWGEIESGHSYYGQLVEVEPGKILAVTQKGLGDVYYPYEQDCSMLQTTFDYERIGVAEQESEDETCSLAPFRVGQVRDFHAAARLRIDGSSGLAYQMSDGSFRFAAILMPATGLRIPRSEMSKEQSALLCIGRANGGRMEVNRKVFVGKVKPGEWAEMQATRSGDILKAAARIRKDDRVVYACVRDQEPGTGRLGLFTYRSTGSFRNVRFDTTAAEIRSRWLPETVTTRRPSPFD